MQDKLKSYCQFMVTEFIREFNFLLDVVANRATAKGDFTDKLSNIVKLGVSGSYLNWRGGMDRWIGKMDGD